MNKQLKELRSKLKREQQAQDSPDSAFVAPDEAAEATEGTDDVHSERNEVLSAGQRFVRPLTLNPVKSLKITLAIIAGLVVAAIVTLAVLIYGFRSDGDIVYRVSRIVPLPAACIDGSRQLVPYPSLCAGGSMISYGDYLFELRSLKKMSQNPAGAEEEEEIDFTTEEGQEQLRELRTLAQLEAQRKLFIRQLAKERDVSVSDEELQEQLESFQEQDGGQEQLEESLERFYGWSMAEFEKALTVQLLYDGLMKQRAEQVREEATAGEREFGELAAEYSGDGSAQEGGDVGYVDGSGEFVEEFETAAQELEEGQISDLVRSQYGFHILKATDTDEDEGVRISHILIEPTFVQEEVQTRTEAARDQRYSLIRVPFEHEVADPAQGQPNTGEESQADSEENNE